MRTPITESHENGTSRSKTEVLISKAQTTTIPKTVDVPDIETQIAPFTLVGLSPLLVNNFSEKSKQELEDSSTGKVVKGKRGAKGKPARIPEEEYQRARILDAKGRDCIPARWIKQALVTAAGMPDVNIETKVVQRTIFVLGDLIPIESESGVHMRTDWVRRGPWSSKTPMQAYRACFDDWTISLRVQFEPRLISLSWLVYLIRRAGLSVGLCEWRPEKKGEMGRFDVKL
jgi:hypothetical protein